MGRLYQLPRDFTAPVVTTYIHGSALYKAQFAGALCPHYHTVRETAERCLRSLVRSARRMRAAR